MYMQVAEQDLFIPEWRRGLFLSPLRVCRQFAGPGLQGDLAHLLSLSPGATGRPEDPHRGHCSDDDSNQQETREEFHLRLTGSPCFPKNPGPLGQAS